MTQCWILVGTVERGTVFPLKLQSHEVVLLKLPRSPVRSLPGTNAKPQAARASWLDVSTCTQLHEVSRLYTLHRIQPQSLTSQASVQATISPGFNLINVPMVLPVFSFTSLESCHHIAGIMIFSKKQLGSTHTLPRSLSQEEATMPKSGSTHILVSNTILQKKERTSASWRND